MTTKAEVTYTTPDGIEHKEIITLALHPIISLDSLIIGGIPVPRDQVRVFEED